MTQTYTMNDRMKGMLYGAIIGDMLGVPFEFETKENMKNELFVGEYTVGGAHDQPRFAWSDDTSMSLAMIDACKNGIYNHSEIMNGYKEWFNNAKYTSNDVVFDYGIGTRNGIVRLNKDAVELNDFVDYIMSESKGNGSLMRIHPIIGTRVDNLLSSVSSNVRITHDNGFSISISMVYIHILLGLRAGEDIKTSYEKAVVRFDLFDEVLPKSIDDLKFLEANGYAYNTLINTVLCVYKTNSFYDAVIMAINLGLDTDTNASIVGAMAGLIYGYKGIDEHLLKPFAIPENIKHQEVVKIIDEFVRNSTTTDYRVSKK